MSGAIVFLLLLALALLAVCGILHAIERDQPRVVLLFLAVLVVIMLIAMVLPTPALSAGVLP